MEIEWRKWNVDAEKYEKREKEYKKINVHNVSKVTLAAEKRASNV